jgi:hypothetical protein
VSLARATGKDAASGEKRVVLATHTKLSEASNVQAAALERDLLGECAVDDAARGKVRGSHAVKDSF